MLLDSPSRPPNLVSSCWVRTWIPMPTCEFFEPDHVHCHMYENQEPMPFLQSALPDNSSICQSCCQYFTFTCWPIKSSAIIHGRVHRIRDSLRNRILVTLFWAFVQAFGYFYERMQLISLGISGDYNRSGPSVWNYVCTGKHVPPICSKSQEEQKISSSPCVRRIIWYNTHVLIIRPGIYDCVPYGTFCWWILLVACQNWCSNRQTARCWFCHYVHILYVKGCWAVNMSSSI